MTPHLQTGLKVLDRAEYEEIAPLVVRVAAGSNPRGEVLGELKLIHALRLGRAPAARR